MGDLAGWLRTVTDIGYSIGMIGSFLFAARVLGRLGGQVAGTGAPRAAVEPADAGGRSHRREFVATAAVVLLALVAGALSVVVWRERSWHLGESVVRWLGPVTPYGPLLVLLGLGIGGWGLWRLRAGYREAFVPGWLGSKLVAWNVAPAGAVVDLERRVFAYQCSLAAATAIVTGLAIVLAGVALSATALMGHVVMTGVVPFMNALYLAQLVGAGIGYPVAARLEQRRLRAAPRYGDLRRRRLADYRSPRLRWLVLLAVVVQTAAAGTFLLLVHGAWAALLMPLLGALAFVVGELHMWSAARVARTVVMDDPATARRCDDLVRAGVIATLQRWQLFSVAYAGLIGVTIAAERVYARTGASEILLAASSVTVAYCLLFAIGIVGLEERLGGRVTGWWGRPMPESG